MGQTLVISVKYPMRLDFYNLVRDFVRILITLDRHIIILHHKLMERINEQPAKKAEI